MKLNMGCGQNKRAGFVNVDAAPECAPDQVVDLETFPWPWADGSAEFVLFNHALEHMGGETKVFLKIMQELYRVCAPGARIQVAAPHPRHDAFISDPTHVRIVTPQVLSLFDRQRNEAWRAQGFPNTPLALYTGVDFAVTGAELVLDEPYAAQVKSGQLSQEEAARLVRTQNNIAKEWRIEMVARK